MKDPFKHGKYLPLMEEFYTVQGEGFHTGKPAYFIRIGGCDIGCKWCDTKASWNADLHPLIAVDKIVEKAMQHPAKVVVVTGGEPSTYNLEYLCDRLRENNIQTFIETSGAYKLTGIWDWVCLSPKKNHNAEQRFYDQADELKMIINEESDFAWAEECSKRVRPKCELFLQPEWSRFNKLIEKIVEYAKNNPAWKVSLQAHKFMHIP